jgi:hypothetical protein
MPGHWPDSSARSLAGRRESCSRAALIEDDDKAGTVFRSDHWIRHPHDLGTVPAPHPGERIRHPVINKPSRHYAGTLRAGAFFSVTVRMDSKVAAAIAAIPETAWSPIKYPRAVWDDQLACWVSDAQVAEVAYTAFTSKKAQAVTARLIVRRVKDLNRQAGQGQDELFTPPGIPITRPCPASG